MSGNSFLLDTNTVLYLLNGDETLAGFLFEKDLHISIITEIELLSYKRITDKEQRKIKEFIKELVVIGISTEIKEKTITIKKQTNLKLPDSIIVATSSICNIPLITSDKQVKNVESVDIIYYDNNI